ncbi:hypothetical protein RJT34_22332 [Clitoria ternatea]|uniref:DNA topoisomerase (ATP-hydrolyzing) n=1 Tax=Clitoria ternatea TaxID=43366 RepID=A0AAN9P6C2_CLITE
MHTPSLCLLSHHGTPIEASLQSSSAANVAAGGIRTIEEMYQKKTQLEYILLRPDTYLGSIEKHTQTLWVYENEEMVHRSVPYVWPLQNLR